MLPVVTWPKRSLFASSSRLASSATVPRSFTLAVALPRAEAAQEQHLGLVHVADAGQVPLVEQGLADRQAGLGAQPPYRLGAVPVRAEQVGTQMSGDA